MTYPRKPSSAALVSLALAAFIATPVALSHQSDQHPEFSYRVTQDTLVGPQELPMGPVTLSLTNTDVAPHMMMLGRLNGGVSLERLQNAVQNNPDVVMDLVTLAGGFGPTMPEQESTLTVDLTRAGSYVALDMMSGSTLPITVTAGNAVTARPQADLVVQMLDFGFDIPAKVEAGEQRWEVVNHGAEVHELILFKLQPGVTLDEVMKAMEKDPEGEPPMAMVGGAMPMAQDYANFVTMKLEPGTYAALCFIPSPANGGAPHFVLGMASEFQVVEQLATNQPYSR